MKKSPQRGGWGLEVFGVKVELVAVCRIGEFNDVARASGATVEQFNLEPRLEPFVRNGIVVR